MQKNADYFIEKFLKGTQFRHWNCAGLLRTNHNYHLISFILLSLLIHFILLVFSWPITEQTQTASIKEGPLRISLVTPEQVEDPVIETPEIESAKPPIKKVIKPKPPAKKPLPKAVKVMTQKQTTSVQMPPPVFTVPADLAAPDADLYDPTVIDIPPEAMPQELPADMMALIKQKRAARIAAGDAGTINAEEIAKLAGLSEAEKQAQRLKDNLKTGTNGVFQITTLRKREGTFAFRGWTGNYSNAQLLFYSVTTRAGEDIRLKLVQRMIVLIRTHYDGDFQWISHRLHETITLSARARDNAGLEAFLMQEFSREFDYYLH